jgi:putative ABC transport system permease protein
VVPEAAVFEIWPFRPADLEAAADSARAVLHVEGAAPGYFGLLDIPILLGRDITLADTAGREMPVVIGSDLARRVWGEANPIGRTLIRPSQEGDTMTLAVVGVFDASYTTTRGGAAERVYTAHRKQWRRDAILVRTRGGAEPFLPALRSMIRDAAPGLPVTRLATREMIDRDEQKVTLRVTALAGAGGALALLLASLGLYGVVSLAVQQRRREIGIRIAVGARPGQVARMFLASGVRVGALALLIGLPVCIIGLRVLLRQDFVIAPAVNPWSIGIGVGAALLAVASGASWVPARRAARVDPATTLRVE